MGDTLDFSTIMLRVLRGQRREVRRVRRRAVPHHHDHPPGPKWSCLHLHIVLEDALSDVLKVYLPMELNLFVDDITACLDVRNKELAEVRKRKQ